MCGLMKYKFYINLKIITKLRRVTKTYTKPITTSQGFLNDFKSTLYYII